MRDHLLGFPPVLLAQDAPVRKQFVTPPRINVVAAFVLDARAVASDNPPGSVYHAPCLNNVVNETVSPVPPVMQAERAPTPPGVWRKTAEHKPPVGAHEVRHADGTLCFDRMFDGVRWLASVDPASPPSAMQTWQWLDTSGEFMVGDRVRYRPELFAPGGLLAALRGFADRVMEVANINDNGGVMYVGGGWDMPGKLEHA